MGLGCRFNGATDDGGPSSSSSTAELGWGSMAGDAVELKRLWSRIEALRMKLTEGGGTPSNLGYCSY